VGVLLWDGKRTVQLCIYAGTAKGTGLVSSITERKAWDRVRSDEMNVPIQIQMPEQELL
jgi:hypothetical protein